MDATHFNKSQDYYSLARTEITHLIPEGKRRVLEIGCGSGNTLQYLKKNGRGSLFGGVKINPDAAMEAERNLDHTWQCSAEQALDDADGPASHEPYDAILCLDVLEHLLDPWTVTKKRVPLLKEGGRLIASIPNVCFYKVSLGLLLKGEWEYQESGVLDSTDLSFLPALRLLSYLQMQASILRSLNRQPTLNPGTTSGFTTKFAAVGWKIYSLIII